MAEVNRVQPNLYEIEVVRPGEDESRALDVTAQDLRDIYDWCLLHMRELEAEAKQAKPETLYLDEPVDPGWLGS